MLTLATFTVRLTHLIPQPASRRRPGIRTTLRLALLLALLVSGMTSIPHVTARAASSLLDGADYAFVYPDHPDPALWSIMENGQVTELPVAGLGLGMADLGNLDWRLYYHATPFLSGDPDNPNFPNTGTFRVSAITPYVSDGPAWFTDAVGWRMILDDGTHRLELALARTPTGNRGVRIQNCAMPFIPFPWDNEFANWYEIARLANGDFVLTLTNTDPASPNPVVTMTIPAGTLPASVGRAQFAWGVGAEGAGAFYWVEAHAWVEGADLTNQPPALDPIGATLDPVRVNSTVSASASFSDPDNADTHTALWDWGDQGTSTGIVREASGTGTVDGDHVYTAPGVYPLTLTVRDDHDAVATATFQYIVVYDPSAGFVTGSGWIDSPAGAYMPDPALSGKASFGFVSRYRKGENTPSGQTDFQFSSGDMIFRSTAYDWLVISGTRAQFKGSGVINGSGNYGFLLTAMDGQMKNSQDVDRFRIKIWDRATGQTVYDNQMGSVDSAYPVTSLGGGAIIIHK